MEKKLVLNVLNVRITVCCYVNSKKKTFFIFIFFFPLQNVMQNKQLLPLKPKNSPNTGTQELPDNLRNRHSVEE